ncbi:MAG: hypothetical protein ACPGTU_13870 [Myxococcota bacterium]
MAEPSATSMINRVRIAGAVAAIVSAFIVFVSGGVIVLSVWVSTEAEKQSTSVNHEVRKMIEAATGPSEEEVASEPTESASPEKLKTRSALPTKSERSSRRARVKNTRKVQPLSSPESLPEKVAEVVPEPVEEPASGGQGNVMFVGDHKRVRLMGGGLTFGAGSVPSGSYTIQATFPDSDPRNAGALVVRDGERLRVHCDDASKRCVRIK